MILVKAACIMDQFCALAWKIALVLYNISDGFSLS